MKMITCNGGFDALGSKFDFDSVLAFKFTFNLEQKMWTSVQLPLITSLSSDSHSLVECKGCVNFIGRFYAERKPKQPKVVRIWELMCEHRLWAEMTTMPRKLSVEMNKAWLTRKPFSCISLGDLV